MRQQQEQLRRLSRERDEQERVVRADQAQIPVQGLGRVQKGCRDA